MKPTNQPNPEAPSEPTQPKETDTPSMATQYPPSTTPTPPKPGMDFGHSATFALGGIIILMLAGAIVIYLGIVKPTMDQVVTAPQPPKSQSLEELEQEKAKKTSYEPAGYLEVQEWGLKFAYPEGVTNVETNYNQFAYSQDSLVIYNIETEEKKYDYSLCGISPEEYAETHNMRSIIFGRAIRYNPNGENAYSITGTTRIMRNDPYLYQYQSPYTTYNSDSEQTTIGPCNDAEFDESEDVKKAVELVREFLYSADYL